MAAGVGKTYRMLQEGQAEAEAGRDVVIGYLEAHERPETIAQSAGLERVPRRGFTYRGNRIEEMNLPGVLERAPELALIDELAHTNAPGGEHAKRYEDVEDVLAAGIDVYSTVNVQHLESLNDLVCEMTGVRVRETIPDGLLAAADEVVLVDITPQSLIERLQAGKVYKPGAIQSALDNFFKIENLSALREVALRQVAEEVEAKRIPSGGVESRPGSDRLFETTVPQQIGERLLALVTPHPRAQRIVRRAWRSAQRLGAELDILWVQAPRPQRRGAGPDRGAAPAGERPRGAPPARARRRRRAHSPARRARARDHLRADGHPARARRDLQAVATAAATAADASAARDRPADRRRSHQGA